MTFEIKAYGIVLLNKYIYLVSFTDSVGNDKSRSVFWVTEKNLCILTGSWLMSFVGMLIFFAI